MSEKIYLADGDGGNSGLWALATSALQNRGIDPSVVALLQNRNNGNDGWGNNSFFDVLLLFILFGWGGNGFGNGGWGNNGGGQAGYAATTERQMLLDAIQRNGMDINTLASSFNCSIGQVNSGINALATQICNLSAQSGQNTASIINSLQMGNQAIASQLCNCCCEIKDAVTRQGYEAQLATVNQTNQLQNAINGTNVGLERGFSNVAYAGAQQTCEIKQAIGDNTRAVLGKLDAVERAKELIKARENVEMA